LTVEAAVFSAPMTVVATAFSAPIIADAAIEFTIPDGFLATVETTDTKAVTLAASATIAVTPGIEGRVGIDGSFGKDGKDGNFGKDGRVGNAKEGGFGILNGRTGIDTNGKTKPGNEILGIENVGTLKLCILDVNADIFTFKGFVAPFKIPAIPLGTVNFTGGMEGKDE
jgi:hypothetical protein